MLLPVLVAFLFVGVLVGAEDDQTVEIPITPDIRAALLQANPGLFGTFEQPTKASCRCKMIPIDLTPYKTMQFRPPVGNPQWLNFIAAQGQAYGG